MTDFTVTILSDATVESTVLRVSVRIPEENAPVVLNPATGIEERDHGNADWPTDDEVASEVSRIAPTPSRSVTRAWTVKFIDSGDDLLEAIYEATQADKDETAEQVGVEWGREIAAERGALEDFASVDEDQYVKDLATDMDFTVLRETLEANGYTMAEDEDEDEDEDGDSKTISGSEWRRLVRVCCQATYDYLLARAEEEAEEEDDAA